MSNKNNSSFKELTKHFENFYKENFVKNNNDFLLYEIDEIHNEITLLKEKYENRENLAGELDDYYIKIVDNEYHLYEYDFDNIVDDYSVDIFIKSYSTDTLKDLFDFLMEHKNK